MRLQRWMDRITHDHVDRPLEQILKGEIEANDIRAANLRLMFKEQINVARRRRIAPGDRAKQEYRFDSHCAQIALTRE